MRNVENTSYDRLFASQPGLPATGAIGNLIGTVASPSTIRTATSRSASWSSPYCLPAGRQSPLIELVPEASGGPPSQHSVHHEDQVHSPRVVMPLAAVSPIAGLTQLTIGTMVRGDDVSELVEACVFAGSEAQPVGEANLDPTLSRIGATHSPSADDAYRVGVAREGCREPTHALDRVYVGRALAQADRSVVVPKDATSKVADRQSCRKLRAVRCILEFSHVAVRL